jgi:hypothetical protein
MKYLLPLVSFLFVGTLFAQAPPSMSYQAVVRDAAGALINTGNVSIKTSILQGSATGVTVQTETHTATTNVNGLASIQIGSINPLSVIDWSNGPYFLKTEIDPTGGSNFTISGVSQLLSVPYALYAASSGNGGGGGTANTLDQAYDQGGAGLGRSITTDAGAVQINNAGTTTTGLEVNTAVANSTAVLANVSGVGVGFRAESSNAGNTFAAIQANTNSSGANNSAILGNNAGAGYGVSGQIPATATGAAGVYGSNLRTTGGYGVLGIGFNGAVGQSAYGAGYGLYGSNSGTTGLGIGTYGVGFNGVYGQTTNTATGWSGYFTADLGVEGAGYAIGGWQLASDRRLKTNIVPIKNALSQLSLIQGTHYTITTPTTSANGEKSNVQRQQYGVIAQDVELVFPELIKEKALFINQGDETIYKTVDYIQLVPVMIEAIKELNTEVDRLKKELEGLQQR